VFVSSDDYRMNNGASCDIDNDGMYTTASELSCVGYYYNGTTPSTTPVGIPFSESAIVPIWAQGEGFINSNKDNINTSYLTGNTMPYVSDDQFNISSYFKTMSFGIRFRTVWNSKPHYTLSL